MDKKIRVAILFGGRSAEHEVSLMSAQNVINAIDQKKYDVLLIGIDKNGRWLLESHENYLLHAENPKEIQLDSNKEAVAIIPDESTKELINLSDRKNAGEIDVVFPLLHGPYGEDGTMQGLLKLSNIPFVGAGVLGSAVGMDKDIMKRLLRDAGVPIGKFMVFKNSSEVMYEEVEGELALPFFVKPANMGSSIGVSKVHDKSEFRKAIDLSFTYDRKILIEEYIEGKEIFCSILGNEITQASVLGELGTTHEFYDYDAKYIDEIEMNIPAPLPENVTKQIQDLAIKAGKVLSCEGMARVDFFVTKDNNVYLNEINTIPGFTAHSWYPKLWEASGISQTELIDTLILLAIERFEKEKKLLTNYT